MSGEVTFGKGKCNAHTIILIIILSIVCTMYTNLLQCETERCWGQKGEYLIITLCFHPLCSTLQSRGRGTKGEYLIIIFRFNAQATQSRLSPQTLANKDDDDGDSVNTSRNQERAMVQKIFDLLGD